MSGWGASRLGRYLRVASPGELARIVLGESFRRWLDAPTMRQARALREVTRLVPPERIDRAGDLLRFQHAVWGRERRFALRRGTSDLEVFLQVIRDEEYREAVRLVAPSGGPARVIDAGANVGLTTLYLDSVFPGAHILALEPEPANHAALERHVRENGLTHVRALQQALWTASTRLAPDRTFRGGRSWSFAVRTAEDGDPGSIAGTTLQALVDGAGWDRVDLLKIDIEGAEAELMRDAATLATIRDRVDVACVEVHEETISRGEVERAFQGLGMRTMATGETLVAWREGRTGRPAQSPP